MGEAYFIDRSTDLLQRLLTPPIQSIYALLWRAGVVEVD